MTFHPKAMDVTYKHIIFFFFIHSLNTILIIFDILKLSMFLFKLLAYRAYEYTSVPFFDNITYFLYHQSYKIDPIYYLLELYMG